MFYYNSIIENSDTFNYSTKARSSSGASCGGGGGGGKDILQPQPSDVSK